MTHTVWRVAALTGDKERISVIAIFDKEEEVLEWFKKFGFWPVLCKEKDNEDEDSAKSYLYSTTEDFAHEKGLFEKEPDKFGNTGYDRTDDTFLVIAELIKTDTLYLFRYK